MKCIKVFTILIVYKAFSPNMAFAEQHPYTALRLSEQLASNISEQGIDWSKHCAQLVYNQVWISDQPCPKSGRIDESAIVLRLYQWEESRLPHLRALNGPTKMQKIMSGLFDDLDPESSKLIDQLFPNRKPPPPPPRDEKSLLTYFDARSHSDVSIGTLNKTTSTIESLCGFDQFTNVCKFIEDSQKIGALEILPGDGSAGCIRDDLHRYVSDRKLCRD